MRSKSHRKRFISETSESWFSDWRMGFGLDDFSPDGGIIDGVVFSLKDDDAVAFIKIGDNFLFGKRQTHFEILEENYSNYIDDQLRQRGLEDTEGNRDELYYELLKSATYDGRLWTDGKVISLWGTPKGIGGMEQMRNDIEGNIGINLSEYTLGYKDGVVMPFDDFFYGRANIQDRERTPVHLMNAKDKMEYWQKKRRESDIPFMGSDVAWKRAQDAGYDTLAAYNFDRENNYQSKIRETIRRLNINRIVNETIDRYINKIILG